MMKIQNTKISGSDRNSSHFHWKQQAVEPGEHLGDGRLGHRVETGTSRWSTQPVYLKAFTGHCSCGWAAHQLVAAGVGGRNGEQGDEKGADFDGSSLPHLEPGRVGLDHHRAAAFEVFVGEPVFLVEVGEGLGGGFLVDLVARKTSFHGKAPEKLLPRMMKIADRRRPGRAGRRDAPQVEVVQIAEGEPSESWRTCTRS